MKNVLMLFILGFAGLSSSAQIGVRLNLELHHVQTLTINPEQVDVTLKYNTLADYKNGVELVQKGHLRVFSTAAYEVKVKLANGLFTKLGTDERMESMSLPSIQIKAVPAIEGMQADLPHGLLTVNKETIISSGVPAIDALFDVVYQGPGGDGLLKYAEKDKITTFSNAVLYSIETK